MTTHPHADLSRAHPRLPFVAELCSAETLSARLGFAVRPVRLRIKPGRSAIVAWKRIGTDHFGGFEDWGWMGVVVSRDKLDNVHRRATRLGAPITVHAVSDPRSADAANGVLLSGSVLSDAKLGKGIARTLDHVDADRAEIIGYNPGRRVLLRHSPDADPAEFVRIGAGSQKHLVDTAAQWAEWNLPTLPVKYLGGRRTAVRSAWWGIGDLGSHPDRGLAGQVGATIADLHRHTPAEAARPARHTPCDQLEESVRAVGRLLPEVEAAVDDIARAVRSRVRQDCAEGQSVERVLHGDLSPDQVLVGGSEYRIIDLDRAGVGPIGMDLGRWVAFCRTLRPRIGAEAARGLEDGFLDGYRQIGGAEIDFGAWTAWAMLVTALEPWRSCDPNWQAATMRIIDGARAVLDRVAGVVPVAVHTDGEEWRVRRAWPADRNRISVEAVNGRGDIRAGFLGENGTEMLAAGRDPKLPGLERLLRARPAPQLISHRPGKRAVLRLTGGEFAKCVRPGRAEAIIAGQDRAQAFQPGFALPQVLSADEATVVFSALPGVGLHEPHRLGDDWGRAWAQVLDAWALVASDDSDAAPHRPDSKIPVHGPDAEVRVLEDWRDRARSLLAHTGDLLVRVDALIAGIRGDLFAGGPAAAREGALGPIHRDLHDKQIMWDPVAGPGLLDVDTACRGERELDLGNLSAHARWRTDQGMWNVDHAEVVLQEIARVTSAVDLDPARVRVYERAALVRLACVYAFRPQWRGRIGRLLGAAEMGGIEAGDRRTPSR